MHYRSNAIILIRWIRLITSLEKFEEVRAKACVKVQPKVIFMTAVRTVILKLHK